MPIWMLGDENRPVPSSDVPKYNGKGSYDKRKCGIIGRYSIIFMHFADFRLENGDNPVVTSQILVKVNLFETRILEYSRNIGSLFVSDLKQCPSFGGLKTG